MRVLVVDDEEKIRNLLRLYIQKEAGSVDVAENGEIALDKALTIDYDVILLDILLPEMNGIEVLQEIRKQKNTPVILLTAQMDDEYVEIAENDELTDFVSKPFSPKVVMQRINMMVAKQRVNS